VRESLPFVLDGLLKATILLGLAALVGAFLRHQTAAKRALWILALAGILVLPALELIPAAHPVVTWGVPADLTPVEFAPADSAMPASAGTTRAEEPAVKATTTPKPMAGADSLVLVALFVWLVGAAIVLLKRILAMASLRRIRLNSEAIAACRGRNQGPFRAADRGRRHNRRMKISTLGDCVLPEPPAPYPLLLRPTNIAARGGGSRPADGEPLRALARTVAESVGVRNWELRLHRGPAVLPAMTWGARRPVVLLPREAAGWSLSRQRVVLLHEFAHIRHRDYLWGMMAAGASILYWCHPLVWYATGQLRSASEHAADDLVVSLGIEPPAYAEELIAIVTCLRGRPLRRAGAMPIVGQSPLGKRIGSILDPSNRRTPMNVRQFLALCAVSAVTLGFASMCGPAQAPRVPTSSSTVAQSVALQKAWPGEHYPATRLQVIDPWVIDGMNYARARYAVNEAYARHGVSFRRKPIREQFLKMAWYRPVPGRYEEASHDLLSDFEKTNVDRLEGRLSHLKSTGQAMG